MSVGENNCPIYNCVYVCKMSVKGFSITPITSRAECRLFHESLEGLPSTTNLKGTPSELCKGQGHLRGPLN